MRPKTPDWAAGLRNLWTPGEEGAHERLRHFADDAALRYRTGRNMPGVAGTSRLSPHLHFGEIGPRQIWRTLTSPPLANGGGPIGADAETFLSEIAWREFSYNLLFHFPTLPCEPLRKEFNAFPWVNDPALLSAWQRGMTGYPIVDAGMRELWATGWMHNRVRMIVASFLIKDLLVDWRQGQAWFGATLLIPRPALIWMRRRKMSDNDATVHFGVSLDLLNWRVRMTGVDFQLGYKTAAKRRA